ncbi:MAG: ferrous iron transport protein B [Armatimonadota bacterium]|nr:ferrous iron transport protein B [Armatimonadota bacterium]
MNPQRETKAINELGKTPQELLIALAGNPNSGKTTFFNQLTGAHQHVGNWPGVTVERKEGTVDILGVRFRIVDLPGIYSLSAYSQEEMIARDFLISGGVDVVVNVVDAANLERNLYLTMQLLELGVPLVIALNMIDEAEKRGQHIDTAKMSRLLGVPVVPTQARAGIGTDRVLAEALELVRQPRKSRPHATRYHPTIEAEITRLEKTLRTAADCPLPSRWLIVKSLEGDEDALNRLAVWAEDGEAARASIESTRRHLETHLGESLETVIADSRYGFIEGLLREVVRFKKAREAITITDRIDAVVLHPWLGIPIFLALVLLTFELTFGLGGLVSGAIEEAVSTLAAHLRAVLPDTPLRSLLLEGVIPGVGGVVVFLPNICILFAAISFLESSGYMARAAFLMDRLMHAMGLHGKSFIPMLMGFGCNVPAIMATRTLESFEDRVLTIMVLPLMSCSARLPIYILFTGVFFGRRAALVIFSLYALGIILAVLSGKLLRRVFFAETSSAFVMELPPYRLPTLKGTALDVWERAWIFLSKAGTVILAASVVVWALGSLPWGVPFGSEQSLAGKLGKLLEPLVAPLGLDWRAAVALLFGIAAKEIVVSTLGILYSAPSHAAERLSTADAVARSFTPLTAYAFMAVSLIYVPCAATIAAIKRETNSWKWTAFTVCYTVCLAYVVGLVIYQVGRVLGVG